MAELLCISYSPWSEKARWALDVRGVAYTKRSYQPLLGEPALRLLLKRFRGPVSVPVLRVDREVVSDSYQIAKYADGRGSGPKLFPAGQEAQIAHYNTLSERGLAAGRTLALVRMLEDSDALLEMVPKALQKRLGPLAPVIARFGIERTIKKYGGDKLALAEHERVLVEVLDTLRADLAKAASTSEPRTLLSAFSYADIAMAQVLAFNDPPRSGLKLGEHSRRAFTHPAISARYADLIGWRDALYARHRGL